MIKFLITLFFVLIFTAPAVAKSKDVYPVSCNDLWAAVKDTLENPGNYAILSENEIEQRASFLVVGNLVAYTDKVALTAKDGGCAMNATILEVGSANSDWLQFSHRLAKSLAKLQAAKPKPAVTATGQL